MSRTALFLAPVVLGVVGAAVIVRDLSNSSSPTLREATEGIQDLPSLADEAEIAPPPSFLDPSRLSQGELPYEGPSLDSHLGPSNQILPEVVADDQGNAIVVWVDSANGSWDIYCQKFDRSGKPQWPNPQQPALRGMPVCTAEGEQLFPKASADGHDGVIVIWEDDRNGNPDLYAQRIGPDGYPQWPGSQGQGRPVCALPNRQIHPQVSSDAFSTLFVWQDDRPFPDEWKAYASHWGLEEIPSPSWDIYALRVDTADGRITWPGLGDRGLPLCLAPGDQVNPQMTHDGGGSAYVVWEDRRTGLVNSDIYAQLATTILHNGNFAGTVAYWGVLGAPVCKAQGRQANPRVLRDRYAGALFVWEDRRRGSLNADIFAQRLTWEGKVAPGWVGQNGDLNGLPIASAPGNQTDPQIVDDGTGRAIVSWIDHSFASFHNIYAQKLDPNAFRLWDPNGMRVCITEHQSMVESVGDGAGGAYFVWLDQRDNILLGGGGGLSRIFATRIDSLGEVMTRMQWDIRGNLVSDSKKDLQSMPKLAVLAGGRGIAVAWEDWSGGMDEVDVRAQFLGNAGQALWAGGPIAVVED